MSVQSLFPSLTFYVQASPPSARKATSFRKRSVYYANKKPELGQWQTRGWGTFAPSQGPSSGNPWNVTKGVFGGIETEPN